MVKQNLSCSSNNSLVLAHISHQPSSRRDPEVGRIEGVLSETLLPKEGNAVNEG